MLEELVGNHPFKGIGRRFLIWNAPDARYKTDEKISVKNGHEPEMSVEEVKANFRLEKLHKLGVLTIFDDEIPDTKGRPVAVLPENSGEDSGIYRRRRTADGIKALADYVENIKKMRFSDIQPIAWRQVDFNGTGQGQAIRSTWHFKREIDDTLVFGKEKIAISREKIEAQNIWVKTSRPGTQKGDKAMATAFAWAYENKSTPNLNRPVLFVNTSLRLDTDSILETLAQFLCNQSDKAKCDKKGPSREKLFDDGAIFFPRAQQKPLVIFKGLERLFSKNGIPLSAEMDGFFRSYLIAAIKNRLTTQPQEICPILIFGTRRMRIYFNKLQEQVQQGMRESSNPDDCKPILIIDRKDDSPSGYLTNLRQTYGLDITGEPALPPALAGDRAYARDTYRSVFSSQKFVGAFEKGSPDEKLAFAVLTVMAFVGQPVEREVLFHAPRVQQAVEGKLSKGKLKTVINKLKETNLVNKIERPRFAGDEDATVDSSTDAPFYMERYALHLTLQAEMRERYGVPLSEAVLSTSFNMSLYAAQPTDAAISDPHVHDELGKLIDWFIGAYKDKNVFDEKHILTEGKNEDHPEYRARPHVAATLRAALAIVRGFYSTSALLSLDIGDREISEQRDGALSEHADRIERLILAFTKLSTAREARQRALEECGDKEQVIKNKLGPGAIYKDELVWLHNERGVVKLTQGDLYEARYSLNEAERINTKYVEFSCRSHNWRRIWLNQAIVDVERGKLAEAEDRLSRIENSFDMPGLVELIRTELGKEQPGIAAKFPIYISHEDCLATALTTGYRGLILHLRGELQAAHGLFGLAIQMLENLDEVRACALFRRHHSSLLQILFSQVECTKTAKLAIAGAESTQQMDIVYGARIVRYSEYANSEKAEERKWAMRNFTQALEFAAETDVHRVAIEARRALATLKLKNGDIESALEHATVAMAMAGRYGMTLYKITLRILLGRILCERENNGVGEKLIQNAIVQADRVGYQRAIDAAQFAMGTMLRG